MSKHWTHVDMWTHAMKRSESILKTQVYQIFGHMRTYGHMRTQIEKVSEMPVKIKALCQSFFACPRSRHL